MRLTVGIMLLVLMPGALCAQTGVPQYFNIVEETERGAQGAASIAPGTAEPIAPGTPACGPMTLAALEQMALASNPTVAQANARVAAARGEWVQTGLWPNPVGGYAAVEIGDEHQAGQQGGMVSQEFVMGRKLKKNRAIAEQDIRRAEEEREAQQLRVLNDVRMRFYDVLVAQEKVQLSQRLVRVGEQGVTATDQLYKAEEASGADLLQARIEFNSARIIAQNANNNYLASWRALAAVVGAPGMPMAPLAGDIRSGFARIEWNEALARVLSTSPELAAAQAGVERARAALVRARAEPIPNVDLQLTAQFDNATSDPIAGVQAVLPVPVWNRNQGGIAKADAELSAARGEVCRVQLALQQRLAAAYERYANAREQVERYESDILLDAQKSLELVNAGYRQGEFSFLVLLTAQRTYFQTNIAYLEALRQLRTSAVEIEGLLLSDSLAKPE